MSETNIEESYLSIVLSVHFVYLICDGKEKLKYEEIIQSFSHAFIRSFACAFFRSIARLYVRSFVRLN